MAGFCRLAPLPTMCSAGSIYLLQRRSKDRQGPSTLAFWLAILRRLKSRMSHFEHTCMFVSAAQPDVSPAQATDRRAAVAMLGGIAALLQVKPSDAAFGEGANIFGKVGNTSGLILYRGKGFTVDLPSKWTPSAERDMPNVVLR